MIIKIKQQLKHIKQMINNGQDNSFNSLHLIQRNKPIIPNWQHPKNNLYSQYKQQKINSMLLDYQPSKNQLFTKNYQTIISQTSRIPSINSYSNRNQIGGIKYALNHNYDRINITDANQFNYGGYSARQKKLSQNTVSKFTNNSLMLHDKKFTGKQTFHKEKTSTRSARAAGTIKSSSIKRKTQVQTNSFDKGREFIRLNNRIRKQIYLEQPRVQSAYSRERELSYQGNHLLNYPNKYSKYMNNQRNQQKINSCSYPRYNNYTSNNEIYKISQLYSQRKQNFYESLHHYKDRNLLVQNQKNYKQSLKIPSNLINMDFGLLKPSSYKNNQQQTIKCYQSSSNIIQQNNKNQYDKQQLYSKNPLPQQKKLHQYNYITKLQKTTPTKVNDNQEQPVNNRREQLISKSKILRQKFNQLSAEKNIVGSKSGKQSITEFNDQSHEQRLQRLRKNKDRIYSSPYQQKMKVNENIKLKYGTLLENKPNQHNNNNKINFSSKLSDLPLKQRENQKGLCKQIKPLGNQLQEKDQLFQNDDPVNRIKSINNKISTKINSIMSYGK